MGKALGGVLRSSTRISQIFGNSDLVLRGSTWFYVVPLASTGFLKFLGECANFLKSEVTSTGFLKFLRECANFLKPYAGVCTKGSVSYFERAVRPCLFRIAEALHAHRWQM